MVAVMRGPRPTYETREKEFIAFAASTDSARTAVDTRVFFSVKMPLAEDANSSLRRRIGSITGPILLQDSQGLHPLNASVWTGPNGGHDEQVSIVKHDARFILLVEKNSIFERLRADGFAPKNRCLLACGNGYPGRSFHRLLRKIQDQTGSRFYVLADSDPGGYEFFFLITRGTASSSFHQSAEQDALAIREASYLGLRTHDYEALGMNDLAYIDLSEPDRKQLDRLSSCEWLKSSAEWHEEFRVMKRRGFKIEMEAIYTLPRSYLAETYLPERIAAGDHLRSP